MGRYLVFVLAFQLLIPWAAYCPVYAQEAPAAQSSTPNLDLSSTDRNVAASSVLPTGQATINLAGAARTISPTDMLTAAEMVAVRQVVNTGTQYLQLNDVGAAIGGGLHLQYYATNGLGNLVIPEGVRATQNAAILQNLNLTGNLSNSGVLNILSTNAAITSATVNATNIYNNVGATISSTLANLNLNAINNIVNAGTIMSAGNLSMTAGGSITNSGIMQAMQNLTMQASTIANQSQIAATLGNINMATANLINSGLVQAMAGKLTVSGMASELKINNLSGILSAAQELSIINTSVIKPLVDIQGGQLLGNKVNFDANDGHLTVNVQDLAGDVNVKGGTAKFAVSAGTHPFNMESWTLTGDPDLILNVASYNDGGVGFNADGGVVEITTTTGGITFTGNITTTPSATGNGGHVYLTSATFIDVDDITTDGNGGNGGDINLQATTTIDTGNLTAAGTVNGDISLTSGGNTTTDGIVVGNNVTYNATGDASLDASVTASGTLSIYSGGTTGIVQTNGTLTGQTIALAVGGGGTIGTDVDPVETATENLSVSSNVLFVTPFAISAGIYIDNDSSAQPLNLSGNGAGFQGLFSLTTSADLNVETGSTIMGNSGGTGNAIEITAGGQVTVEAGAAISAYQGYSDTGFNSNGQAIVINTTDLENNGTISGSSVTINAGSSNLTVSECGGCNGLINVTTSTDGDTEGFINFVTTGNVTVHQDSINGMVATGGQTVSDFTISVDNGALYFGTVDATGAIEVTHNNTYGDIIFGPTNLFDVGDGSMTGDSLTITTSSSGSVRVWHEYQLDGTSGTTITAGFVSNDGSIADLSDVTIENPSGTLSLGGGGTIDAPNINLNAGGNLIALQTEFIGTLNASIPHGPTSSDYLLLIFSGSGPATLGTIDVSPQIVTTGGTDNSPLKTSTDSHGGTTYSYADSYHTFGNILLLNTALPNDVFNPMNDTLYVSVGGQVDTGACSTCPINGNLYNGDVKIYGLATGASMLVFTSENNEILGNLDVQNTGSLYGANGGQWGEITTESNATWWGTSFTATGGGHLGPVTIDNPITSLSTATWSIFTSDNFVLNSFGIGYPHININKGSSGGRFLLMAGSGLSAWNELDLTNTMTISSGGQTDIYGVVKAGSLNIQVTNGNFTMDNGFIQNSSCGFCFGQVYYQLTTNGPTFNLSVSNGNLTLKNGLHYQPYIDFNSCGACLAPDSANATFSVLNGSLHLNNDVSLSVAASSSMSAYLEDGLHLSGASLSGFSSIASNIMTLQDSYMDSSSITTGTLSIDHSYIFAPNSSDLNIQNSNNLTITNASVLKAGADPGKNLSILNYDGDLLITNQSILDAPAGSVYLMNTNGNTTLNNGVTVSAVGPNFDDGVISILNSGGSITIESEVINTAVTDIWGSYCYGCSPNPTAFGAQGPTINSSGTAELVTSGGNLSITGPGTNDIWSPAGLTLISTTGSVNVNQVVLDPFYFDSFYDAWYLTGMSGSTFTVQVTTSNIVTNTIVANNSGTSADGTISLIVNGNGSLRVQAGSVLSANEGNVFLQNLNTAGTIIIEQDSFLTAISDGASLGNVYLLSGPDPGSYVTGSAPANLVPQELGGGEIFYGSQSLTTSAPDNYVTADGGTVAFNGTSVTSIQLGGNVTINAKAAGSTPQLITSLDLVNDPNAIAQILALQGLGAVGGTLQTSGPNIVGGNAILNPSVLAPWLTAENIPNNVTIEFTDFDDTTPTNVYLTSDSTTSWVTVAGTHNYTNGDPILNIVSNVDDIVLRVESNGTMSSAANLLVQGYGDIRILGDISADNLTIATTGNDGGIEISGGANGLTSLVLIATGSGNITAGESGGDISAPLIILTTNAGNIGVDSLNRLEVNAGVELQVNTNTGSAYISQAGSVQLGSSSLGQSLFQSTTVLDLLTTADGDIIIDGDTIRAGTINLTAGGSGNIDQTGNNTAFEANSMSLQSTSGWIGGPNSTTGLSLALQTQELSAGTTGDIYINSTGFDPVTLKNISAGLVLDLTASTFFTIANGFTVQATGQIGTPAVINMTMNANLLTVEGGARLQVNTEGTISIFGTSQVTNDGVIATPQGSSGGTIYEYSDGFAAAVLLGTGNITGDLSIISTNTGGFMDTSVTQNSIDGRLNIESDSDEVLIQTTTGNLTLGTITNSAGTILTVNNNGNIILDDSTIEMQSMTAQINLHSLVGSVTGTLASAVGTVRGSALLNFNVTNNDPVNGTRLETIITNYGSITITNTTGDVTILGTSNIYANQGNLTINNLNTTDGQIIIEANAELTASASDDTAGRVYLVIGGIPPSPDTGATPSNVTANELNGGLIYFGTGQVSASSPTNTVTADGTNASVVFSIGAAPGPAIQLGGGVTITSQTEQAFTPLTSLDLSDAAVITAIEDLQTAHYIGGTIDPDNTAVILPYLLDTSLTAINVPINYVLTLANYDGESVNVDITGGSTTSQATVNGTLQFVSASGTSTSTVNITSTEAGPAFMGTGQMLSDGSLTANVDGAIEYGGILHANTNLTLDTSANAIDGSITLSSQISSNTASGTGGIVNLNAGTTINIVTINSSGLGIGNGGAITLNAEGDISIVGLISNGGDITGSAGTITISSTSGSVTLGSITATAQSGNASGLVNINAYTGFTGGDIEGASVSIITEGGQIALVPGSNISINNGNLLLQNNDTVDGTIYLGTNSTFSLTSTLGDTFGNVYIVLGDVPTSPVEGPFPPNMNTYGSPYFGTNGITSNAPSNSITAPSSTVIFNTGSAAATAITLDGNVRIESEVNGSPGSLASLDLTDPFTVNYLVLLQEQAVIGGTLVVDNGIATGGNVILAPANLPSSLTAYNIPDNVTVTMQGFTDTDFVTIDITGASTTSQAILGGTHEFTGAGAVGQIEVTSTQAGPAFLVNSTGLLTSEGNLSITSPSITNEGSITSPNNGTITVTTNDFRNDTVTSLVDAGGFGTVVIQPNTSLDVLVGGTTHSGVTLDITATDLANIAARNLTIGDASNTNSLNLAGNVDVSGLYNLQLLSADTYDSDGNSITLGFNTLDIEAGGDASTNVITGVNTTIEIIALGTLTINDQIEAVDPGSAFSINGNIHLSGSPVMFNLDPGENINAGTFNGIVTIDPSAAANVNFFTTTQSGVTFDISQGSLDHIRTRTLNIGNLTTTDSITLADDVDLGFNGQFQQLNFYTNGSYDYNNFAFDAQNRSVGIYALGQIDAGEMTNGSNTLVMEAGGAVTLNGQLSGFTEVTLAGSPVILNNNTITAFTSVTLRPTTSMDVNVSGGTASGSTFDITATDLANISTALLTIGDGSNAASMTVVDDLDISGPINDPGSFDLALISNGDFSSQGQIITLGRQQFDNFGSLTVTTFGSAEVGSIVTIADTGAIVYITAGGNLNLNANITVTDGTVDGYGRIELRGSPVTFNGNSLDAGPTGFVALAPTSDTVVAINDALGTAAPFDISAGDLANITTGTLQIGDIYHTLTLNVEDDMDLSSTYNLVLVSAGAIDRTGISITLGTNNLGLSTNGGLTNLATGDLDISYIFDGNTAWRQAYDGSGDAFSIMTGGSSTTNVISGWIDMGIDGGSITIDAGRNFNYTASGAIITFVAGTSSTGGYVGLNNVNLTTSGGDNDIVITGRGDPVLFMGGVAIGSVSNSSIEGEVTIVADNSASVGSPSVSRINNDFSVVADGSITTWGSIVANNITLNAIDYDGGVAVQDNLYADDTINISSNGTGGINFFTSNSSSYIEAPTILISADDDPTASIIVSNGMQIVATVNIGTPGTITITTPTLTNEGLIAAPGAGGNVTIQAPAGTDLTITRGFDDGRLVADPLSGLITLQSADGEVNVTQREISGVVTGSAQTAFYLTSHSGLLSLSNITADDDEITITSGSDMQIIPSSTLSANGSIALASTGSNASLLISADNISSTSNNVDISNFSYIKNDSTITADNNITIQNTLSSYPDLILTGSGTLVAPSITLTSTSGAVIATQNNMQGTVDISSESTLVLSVLNPSSFTPGTMTSTAYGSASLRSGFSSLYSATHSSVISFGDAVFATTTGTFFTFFLNAGHLDVSADGNLVIMIRDTDAGAINTISGISTSGGNLYVDTTTSIALNFTGNLDTRGGTDTSGGYVVLGSTNTIDTEAIITSGVGGGGLDEDRSGGSVRISSTGNTTINEYIDTRGEELGSGGSVTLLSVSGDVTFAVTDPLNGNINAVGGSEVFAEGTGGNILIGAGDAVTLNSFIDSSAEPSLTTGSRGSAGWIHIAATSISSSGSIRANGGADFSSASGNGGSITLVAGSISVGGFIDSAGLGSGFGGDITLRAGSNISLASANATGGRTSAEIINGGNIVIQSNAGTITATSFIDSSASAFNELDGGGRAGMVFIVAPTSIDISSIRAEGRSKPGNESSDLPGNGGNIRIETNGEATFDFVSSSAQSIAATRAASNGSAGRIDVLAIDDVNATTFKATGSLSGGNGGDVNITSNTGNVTTSFIFTTAVGYDIFDNGAYGDGGNISITSAGSVTINSFIDTGGSANFGNGGSVTIQAENDINSVSYLAANAVGGNGGNIVLVADTGEINFAFSLDTAARGNGNGGYIVLDAQTGIQATIVASRGGETGGHGGDIVMSAGDAIQLSEIDSRTEHNDLIGSSNAGEIFLQTSNGNIVVQGNIIAAAEGISGNAGDITISYNNGGNLFVIDPTNSGITNGVVGTIFAQANGAGNGGAVSIFNTGGNLNVTLNSDIDVTSNSGDAGSINFNYEQPNSPASSNPNSAVNVSGTLGFLLGTVYATGQSVDINISSPEASLTLGNVTATAGNINATLGSGLVLSVLTGAELTATEGNIVLRNDNTASGSFLIGANSTLTATATSAPYGNIYIVIGPPPGSPVAGTQPSNLVVDEQNGGQVFFGTNGITANAPDNHANADGADIVFNTDTLAATAITLDGNVTLNATLGGGATLLDSLDLTDPTVTALIINLQGTMDLGGTLIVDGGGIATGGNIIIGPSNLAAALTAYNIPDNVTVTMQDFTVSDVLTIDITAGSTTSQAILSGTHEYTGASPSAGVLTITSDQAGPVFLVNSTALLTSNGSLTVNVNGDVTLSGDVSATTALAISTTANNGAISIDHDISAGSIAMTAHGSGAIQGVTGTLTANSLTFTSGSGAIVNIVSSTASLAANTTGVVNVNNSGSTPLSIGLSSANSFTVSNDHDITVSGTITATNALSLTTTANDGSISINADTSGTGITISTQGNGIVSVAAGEDLRATNGTLQITTHNVTFDGTLTADNGDIMILANNNQDVVIGGTSGTLNITSAVLNAINGSNFLVGYGTSMTVVDDIDISGTNFSALYLQPNGNYSAQGQTITLGDKTLNVQILSSGTVDTGTVTGTSGSSATFSSDLALTVSGPLTVGSSIQLSTNSGNIDVAANMSASSINVSAGLETLIGASITGNSVIVSGSTGISRSGNFTITSTGTLTLSSSNHGDIGSLGTPILTDAGNLSVSTNPNTVPYGNAYISNSGNVNITGLIVRGDFYLTTTGAGADITTNTSPSTLASTNGVISLTANGSITAGMNLVGQTIVLQTSSGTDGNIALNRNVTGTNGVTITTDGIGTVSNAVGRSISSTNSPIVITANGVNFSGTVNAGASGSVTLRPNGSQTISVGTGGGGDFDVSDTTMSRITAGTLIVGSTSQSGSLTITSSLDVSGTGAGTFNLQFDTGGNYTAAGQTLTLGTKSLTVNALGTLNTGAVAGSTASVSFTSGNGLTVSSALALSGDGSIGLTATGASTITLNNDLTTAAGGQVTITTGSGDVSQQSSPARTVTSGTLTLNSTGGSFGTSFSDTIDTSVSNLIVNSTDEAYIFNTGALTIGPSGATSTADTLDIQNNQAITIDGDITTTTVTSLYTTSGAINVNADLTSETIGINTSAGTVTTAVSTHIEGTGFTGAVGIFGDDIDLNGTITANATAFTGVVLGTNTGIDIEFAGTGSVGVFNVSVANLSGITANWLTINGGDDMTIVDDFDFGTTSFKTINFNPGGGYVGTGQELSLASNQELNVSASGSDLYTGTISGSSSSYVVFSLGGSNVHLIIDGVVTAGHAIFTNSSGGNVVISANAGDPNGITSISALNAGSNNITRTGNFTLSGANVNLQSDNGDLGTSSTPLLTSADILQVNATAGNAYIAETNDITILGNVGGEIELTSSSGQVTVGWLGLDLTTDNGSATIIANGDIHVTEDITVNEGNLILQDMNTSSGAIVIDEDLTLSATTTGDTLGRVYIFIGTSLPTGTNTTAPANVVVNNTNGGTTYFGTNSITASAPDNTVNSNGSSVVFDTGSLPAGAISLGGNVTINGTAQPVGGGPVYSLDFTDPDLTALILSLQGTMELGGTLEVNGQGVATGGNVIIGYNMLSTTLTGTNIPTGVTITFDDFSVSDTVDIDITESSYSNVAIIAGTLQFDTSGSPSAGVINIMSDQASASGNPAFALTGTGQLISDGSLSLSASGRMIIDGTVSAATNLTLSTTANNGNINITGDVSATNSATLSLNGNGTVTGTIDTPTLNFSSSMGNLGNSPSSRFVTNANSLSVNTGGNAYINNTSTGTLTVGATSSRILDLTNNQAVVFSSTLQVQQNTEIVVTANNGGVTFNDNVTSPNWIDVIANGSGDIVQNAGTIRSSSIYLSSGTGNIGSSGNPINTNAYYTTFISAGGDVYINSSNSVRIHNPSSGDTVSITSNGQIEVFQPITSSGSVTFNGAGSIHLHADVTASSFVSLFGNGHGNILNLGGSIITPTVTTSTGTGSIGTDVAPIDTTAGDITSSNINDAHFATSSTLTNFDVTSGYVALTLNITGDLGSSGTPFNTSVNQLTLNVLGAAYVNASNPLTLGNSTVRDTVQISANGNLTVNDLVTTTGSISLTAQSGILTINPGSTVQANEGNVTLTNNSASGAIFVGNGALVKGFTVSNESFGNVTMTVGSSIGTAGTAPGNVTENIVEDGQIIIGNNGFTSNNSGNTLDALDRTITIDAGATGSIVLDGDVTISADPPIAQVTAPSSIANILPLLSVTSDTSTTSSTISTQTPLGSANVNVQPVVLDTTLITRPLNVNFDQYQLINDSSTPAVDPETAPETSNNPVYQPIAYATPATAPDTSTITNAAQLSQADFGSCQVRHAGADVSYSHNGTVNLNSGEILIHNSQRTFVQAGHYSISIDPGSVALITREGNVVKVRALHEAHMNDIVITAADQQIKLSVGQEVMLAASSTHLQVAAQKDSLGRRHVVNADLSNGHAMSRSEFSHIGLMEQSHVLTKLVQSKSPADKQLAAKLIKTAACLMTVTGTHGAFTGK